eukprot:UN02041
MSLAMVMAGTGNLEVFKLMRNIRMAIDKEISYGHHMALNMAIGLLFLGGGRLTLGRSNLAIASLLIAFDPRWPRNTEDNQHHLQACRHLYVLAVESRYVQTIDIDRKEACWVPLDVTLKETKKTRETTIRFVTPCILPEFSLIKEINASSPRYYPQCLDVAKNPQHLTLLKERGIIFVKRKVGHLMYNEDHLGQKGVLSRCFPKKRIATKNDVDEKLLLERLQRNQEDFIKAF